MQHSVCIVHFLGGDDLILHAAYQAEQSYHDSSASPVLSPLNAAYSSSLQDYVSVLQSKDSLGVFQPHVNSTLCLGIYCLEGPHLRQAIVMQPGHFFIKIHESWTM